jgi:hypothetical protein
MSYKQPLYQIQALKAYLRVRKELGEELTDERIKGAWDFLDDKDKKEIMWEVECWRAYYNRGEISLHALNEHIFFLLDLFLGYYE